MVRNARLLPLLPAALLLAGGGLLADAALRGSARLYLLVVFPVITGASLEFFLGVLLVVLGFFTLPLLLVPRLGEEGTLPPRTAAPLGAAETPGPDAEGEAAGFILVGPVPIFFGRWRKNPPVRYLVLVLLGAAALALALVVLFLL